MVIGESTEGDHGDPVCDDEFRVQRVAVQSAEAAKSMATDRADQVGAKIAQRKAAETTPGHRKVSTCQTGDRSCRV
ncbi:hypothetical protein DPMN_114148 [Dreissena polymorpha]|uniref:Uncharacterized protein n=1 Tax=Dreissena polymorpha TaxID=45954 RepID=A0A9D4KJH5_DREPO|nr:hypothetical protein DPMN_114148 [Dreissena polymorpha]